MFDPLLHYEAKRYDENLRMMQMELLAQTAMCSNLSVGAPGAIGAICFWREVEKLDIPAMLRRIWGGLHSFLFQADPQPVDLNNLLVRRFGIDLPLGEDAYRAMMDEVRRYRWIEAERAGRDIWSERNPADPEVAAFQEWFRNHFGAWYITRYTGKATA